MSSHTAKNSNCVSTRTRWVQGLGKLRNRGGAISPDLSGEGLSSVAVSAKLLFLERFPQKGFFHLLFDLREGTFHEKGGPGKRK